MLRSLILAAAIAVPFASAGAQSADPAGSASSDTAAAASTSQATAATEADVKVGASVKDSAGATVGTVKELKGDNVVITTSNGPIQVKLASVGKANGSLALATTKAEIYAAVAGATKQQ